MAPIIVHTTERAEIESSTSCCVWNRSKFKTCGRNPRPKPRGIAMTFKLPENIATRPIAILGVGTLGSRIALMLATRGAEVRLYARSAATRDAGVAFAREQLPAVLATLPGSRAGTIVGVDDMAAALKDAWIVVESVPENLELKKDIFKQVDALSESDAILASNSSSYSSSAFADSVKNPARLLNTHFLRPPATTPVGL